MANILIVDDDSDTADLAAAFLERAGYHVQTCGNGVDGLSSLCIQPFPDCVLLDVEMPSLSGPEMAHTMRQNGGGEENIPILLTSGRDDLTAIAARMGTPYFLVKAIPDYRNALLKLISRVIIERRAPTHA